MKLEGGSYYLRAVNDGASTVVRNAKNAKQ